MCFWKDVPCKRRLTSCHTNPPPASIDREGGENPPGLGLGRAAGVFGAVRDDEVEEIVLVGAVAGYFQRFFLL